MSSNNEKTNFIDNQGLLDANHKKTNIDNVIRSPQSISSNLKSILSQSVKSINEIKSASSSTKSINFNKVNNEKRANNSLAKRFNNLAIRKSSKNKQTNLDYILSLIGSFGLYQKLQFVLVGFLAVVPSMVAYSYVFVAATPNFTCVAAEVKQIISTEDEAAYSLINPNGQPNNFYVEDDQIVRTETIRRIRLIDEDKLKDEAYRSQIIFDNSCELPIRNLMQNSTTPASTTSTINPIFLRFSTRIVNNATTKKNGIMLKCLTWLYDQSMYGPTIATEWNLVCVRSYLKALTQNAYIMGTACAILSGIMSDKIGRKTSMMIMITLMAIVLNFTQLLMHQQTLDAKTKFTIFTVSRFLQGFAQTMYAVSFVLLMEITGPQNRVLAGNIMAYSFACGQMILVLLAYYLRDWRKIMWSLAIYVMPFFTYYWLVPESPRWLLSKDKVREAQNVLKKISILNNTYNYYMAGIIKRLSKKKSHEKYNYMQNYLKNEETSVYIHTLLQEEANKFYKARKTQHSYTRTLVDITKSRTLMRRCFILFYIWSVILMVYLGIGMGITNVMDKLVNPHLIFLLQAICEFFGIVTCHLVLNRYGRKIPLIIFMILSAIVIVLVPVLRFRYPIASCVVYLIAKYSISAAQLTCMIYTSELYPTPMRGTGVGLSATISRLGGVWAPQINVLSSTLGFYVPYVVFSAFSLLAGISAIFLPETLNKSLPENVIEAEKMDKDDSK